MIESHQIINSGFNLFIQTLTSGRSLPAIPQVEPSHLLTGTDFEFKAEITKSGFENLALITSKDLNNWKKSGEYHFVANVRHDAVEILDTWYDGKISISNQHGTGFDVKISDQQTTDYYMVIGLCDPMDSKCKGTVFKKYPVIARQRHLVTGRIIFSRF